MPKSATTFAGFPKQALTFFRQLERNNDRDWFTPRKEQFQQHVYEPMVELVTRLGDRMRAFAPDYCGGEPKRVIYRIYRDTRFAKDKTPYKAHLGAHFQHGRIPKNRGAGFYVHVCHKEVCVAGGVYMPGPEELAALRAAFVRREDELRRLLGDRTLTNVMGAVHGAALARVPKGCDPDSAAGDLLRRKQLYFYADLDAKLATTARLETEVLRRFELMAPLVDFLNGAILAARSDDTGRDAIPVRPAPMF